MIRGVALAVSLSVVSIAAAGGGISPFVNNQAVFEAQADAFLLVAVEDFEDNTLLASEAEFVASGLSDASSGPDFPNGLSLPVTITATSGLRATKNLGNVVGTVLGNDNNTNILSLAFDEEDRVKAVGFNPVTPLSDDARYSVTVDLFDGTTLSAFGVNPIDAAGSSHVGFLTGPDDAPIRSVFIGVAQINGSANNTLNGLDNLAVYVIPEPGTAALLALVVSGWRRRAAC